MKVEYKDRKITHYTRDYFIDKIKMSSEFIDFLKIVKKEPGYYRWTDDIPEDIKKLNLFSQSQGGGGFGAHLTKKGKLFLKKLSEIEKEDEEE